MSTQIHLLDEEEEQEVPGFDAEAFAKQALSSRQSLAAAIDHTLLKPDATQEQVIRLCREAAEHGFACAMVNPTWAALAYAELAGTGISVGVVVGFPLGASLGTTKREEALALVKIGAHDVDMVVNIGLLKSGENQAVQQEIEGVVEVGARSRSRGEGDSRNLSAHRRRKVAGFGVGHCRRGRLPQNQYGILDRRR